MGHERVCLVPIAHNSPGVLLCEGDREVSCTGTSRRCPEAAGGAGCSAVPVVVYLLYRKPPVELARVVPGRAKCQHHAEIHRSLVAGECESVPVGHYGHACFARRWNLGCVFQGQVEDAVLLDRADGVHHRDPWSDA
jgi:hypothetical protein